MTTPVEWLAALVKWIVDTFKGDIIVVVKKQILRWWRKLFAGKNVLILGGKATGKTSLLMFLQNGRPYEIGPDGQKRYPNPTGVGAIIDKRVNVNDQGWIQLTKDIGGDPDLRPFWRRLTCLSKFCRPLE